MNETLQLIARKVREAERALPRSADKTQELCMGADGTPTCLVDKVAEDVILQFVEERNLPYNVLSEEAGFVDRKKAKTLVVDPIDGTYNSAMGVPFYSVSLAIGTKSLSDVEAGLVQNLVTGDTYWAERGKGATLNGEPIHVRQFDPYNNLFLVYIGKYASEDNFHFARLGVRARALGCASLEMCLLAEGKADAYYMNCEVYEKSIRVVDIAASALILREAGGGIVDLLDRPLDMGLNLRERSNFLAYGDKEIKRVVM
ncbi:MAG TPA: inositol monophosphatase family protein [Methanomassiliicoccales archaeon]|nr:inositol monophosphatase family protein [Methanomassiliicoccales archaeon]